MNFKINISPQALAELKTAYYWLLERTEQHAPLWYMRVLASIDSLEQFPTRCPIAPENRRSKEEVRHLIVGDKVHAYRIVFMI